MQKLRQGSYRFSWHEIRERYLRLTGPRTERGTCTGESLDLLQNYWLKDPDSDPDSGREPWSGGSAKQAREWLTNGYTLPADSGQMGALATDVERPRWVWSDDSEGELDWDLYRMGETECYRSRTRRKQRAGINVEVQMNFSSGVRAPVLAAYARFVGRAMATIQAQGFDVNVDLFTQAQSRTLYPNGTSGEPDEVRINVSRFGEKLMFREWSALFSPIGFRHLVFCAMAAPQDMDTDNPPRVPGSLGIPYSPEWKVTFDAAERRLSFLTNCRSNTFPTEDMERQLQELVASL